MTFQAVFRFRSSRVSPWAGETQATFLAAAGKERRVCFLQ